MTGAQCYDGSIYNNGALAIAFATSWAVELSIGEAHHRGLPDLERELSSAFANMRNWYGYLPLNSFPLLKQNDIARYFLDWLDHPTYDDYWKQWSVDLHYDQIAVPAFSTAGWYDVFRDGTIKNFTEIRRHQEAGEKEARHKLIIGPWYHVPWARFTGQLDFGDEARNVLSEAHLKWFDYWLKGLKNNIGEEPPVHFFVMGDNVWRDDNDWPPSRVRNVNYYFHSQRGANSLNGDGTLDLHVPGDETPDIYVYNPRSPVPSLGGHSCCFSSVVPMGPADQRDVELQNQVLIYTTGPLQESILVTGPVTVSLWATTSARDTDFTVKLVDVYPDGRAINLTEGIVRACYRDSLENPKLLLPGEVYRFTIQAGNTCNMFKEGHCIRVEISSSNFPHWDRNTNTGNVPSKDHFSDLIVATQVVFHDSQRPSHISIPTIPNR
jgi:putative CocE/NonD family hydrolase